MYLDYLSALPYWILFADRRPTLAIGLLSALSVSYLFADVFVPASFVTMSMNKSLQMDPHASRLVVPVTGRGLFVFLEEGGVICVSSCLYCYQTKCSTTCCACLFMGFFHLAHGLLYAHRLRGLKKLPARGRGPRLSASPPDHENDVMRTVREHGRPKYTLAFSRKTSPEDVETSLVLRNKLASSTWQSLNPI